MAVMSAAVLSCHVSALSCSYCIAHGSLAVGTTMAAADGAADAATGVTVTDAAGSSFAGATSEMDSAGVGFE